MTNPLPQFFDTYEAWFYQKKDALWELITYNFIHYTLICVVIVFVFISIFVLGFMARADLEKAEKKYKELEAKWEKEEGEENEKKE